MPDQQNHKTEKSGKSVLEPNHPLFVKIRRELPLVQARSIEKSHPYLAWLREKAKEYHFTHLGPMLLAAVVISFFIYRKIADPFLD